MRPAAFSVLILGLLAGPAFAEVHLPHIFGDHMVLQSGQPVPVWGTADPGEHVTVKFGKQTQRAVADVAGKWRVTLKPLGRSNVAAEMTVKGAKESKTFTDVLVGEVWLASGQSNMQKPLGPRDGEKPTFNYEEELKSADIPEIRLFKVKKHKATAPGGDVDGTWVVCSPASLMDVQFSAAAYYFGKDIHAATGAPIGLIDSSYGGTRIEPWTSPSGFPMVPSLKAYADASQTPGKMVDESEVSTLFYGMVQPLIPYAIKGAIWYQGESNIIGSDDGDGYADKMTALVQGWRQDWGYTFPFYYVQVAPHLYHVYRHETVSDPEATPRLWEAQTASMRLPRTGMVVTTDIVDDLFDIHPRDKKDVGDRLARWALNRDYGHPEIVVSGPIFKSAEFGGGKATVSFDDLGGGLAASDGKPLSWFTLAGKDGRFWPATAVIDGDRVVVTSPKVPEPTVVRFGWDEAAQPNLASKAGLPGVPFRSDNPFGAPIPAP
ncbi:MAG TPA: sialate O-acetylesterase [Asticcacaulis sp.]|nr:sialate O-acetylesterase [Asticcacaulis sp.]